MIDPSSFSPTKRKELQHKSLSMQSSETNENTENTEFSTATTNTNATNETTATSQSDNNTIVARSVTELDSITNCVNDNTTHLAATASGAAAAAVPNTFQNQQSYIRRPSNSLRDNLIMFDEIVKMDNEKISNLEMASSSSKMHPRQSSSSQHQRPQAVTSILLRGTAPNHPGGISNFRGNQSSSAVSGLTHMTSLAKSSINEEIVPFSTAGNYETTNLGESNLRSTSIRFDNIGDKNEERETRPEFRQNQSIVFPKNIRWLGCVKNHSYYLKIFYFFFYATCFFYIFINLETLVQKIIKIITIEKNSNKRPINQQ